MSCIITYKGKSYSEAEFKTFLENNYKDVVDSLYSDKVPANFTNHSGRASNNKDGVFRLNKDQEKAYQEIKEFLNDSNRTTHSLIGYAGSGKTTLINEVLKEAPYNKVILSSPTNRANAIIRNKVKDGQKVVTLHKLLGLAPGMDMDLGKFDVRNLKFEINEDNESVKEGNTLIIIDEASMINDELFQFIQDILIEDGTNMNKILFIGDSAQLKPVKQNTESLALNSTEGVSSLTIVERANNNALLSESMAVRETGDFTYKSTMDDNGNGVLFMNNPDQFIDKIVDIFKSEEFKKDPLHLRVIAGTNESVNKLNKLIKEKVYGSSEGFFKNEIVTGYSNWGKTKDGKYAINNGGDYVIKNVSTVYSNNLNFLGSYLEVQMQDIELKDLISGSTITIPMLYNVTPQKAEELGRFLEEARVETIDLVSTVGKKAWAQYFKLLKSFGTPVPATYKGKHILGKTFDTGFAHTIHKSQGGTYANIAINEDSINNFNDPSIIKQLKYVAVTRAENGAYIFTKNKIENKTENKVETKQEVNKTPPSLSSLLSSGLLNQQSENFESPREDMFDYPNIKNCN